MKGKKMIHNLFVPCGGVPPSALMQGLGARPCLYVICHALSSPTGGLTLAEEWMRDV